jgi:hypothetical protein
MVTGEDSTANPGQSGQGLLRQFVNHVQIGLSLSEIRFELSTIGARFKVWRFVTTPDHMFTIHRDLGSALDSYRARFGDIHASAGEPPDIRIDRAESGQDGAHG